MNREPMNPCSPFAVVVNDDPTQLDVLSGLVRKAGLEPRAFTAAEAALADMSACAGTADRDPGALPALVVTDLYMPGIDGWPFCRLLRSPEYAAFNQVPILVVSATFAGDEADRIAADLGAEAFLPSPVDGKRFVEQVRAILSGERVRTPLRVLIVEDSTTLAGILKKAFAAHGYQADTALTARAAADAFAKTAYDVAVLDYHLPDGTGDALLDAFRAERSDCVCLMMTTDPGPELALDWMKRGAAAYAHKPFEPDYLIELCAKARRERALLRVQDLLEVRTRELRESEARYRGLFEHMAEGYAYCRMIFENGEPRDFIYLAVNTAFETLTGLRNVTGKKVSEVIPSIQEVDPQLFAICGRVSLTGKPEKFEMFVEALQMWFWISVYSPAPEHFVAVFDNITVRKRAEDGLRVKDWAIESATYAIVTSDLEGNLNYVNPAFLKLWGYSSPAEILGKPAVGFWQMGEKAAEVMEAVRTKGGWIGELVAQGKDGALFDVHVASSMVVNDAGQPVCIQASFADITGRKRAEEELKRRNVFVENLLEQAPIGFAVNTKSDGRAVFVSRNFERIYGVAPDSMHSVADYFEQVYLDPVFREKIRERIMADMATGDAARMRWEDIPITTQAGEHRVVTAINIPLPEQNLMISTVQDVTQRKRAEEALRESEERYQRITEAITDYIYSVRVAEGRAVETTHGPGCLAVTGYRANEFANDPCLWFRMVAAEDGPKVEEQARRILAGEDPPPIEHLIVHKNGTVRWVRNTFVPHRDERGALLAYDGLIQDITERKRAAEEKAKLEAQLQQAQKMESVGRLAGGVAHDFNNMLGVILGHADLALEQVDPAQPLHDDLTEIRKAAKRSADLTRQLLAFARKQTIAPKVLDLNETVEGMLKMLRPLIGEDIDLAWLPGAGLWPVKLDPSQIDQILANLCVNARDAISGVGKITIETGNVALDEDYCAAHAGFVPGEFALLAVSDDGCGMDKETLAHIFEPFFTTKEVGKGTGLGLATIYGIVKQNNGFINAYSEPDQGSTFRIYLPRHMGKAGQMQKKGPAEPALRGQEIILLVEDEPAILTLTTMILERQGYTVLAANTPGEAIRLAREHAGEIHLLMTDVVMPEMNGRDLAKNLLSLYPHLKRLFMSGYTANVIAHHGVLDGGVYFIQKPFSIKELAAKVREALGGMMNDE